MLIELAEGVMWVWDAAEDYHGTTANSLRLRKPGTWQKFAKDDPSVAQCTVASVLPKAVLSASKAHLRATDPY